MVISTKELLIKYKDYKNPKMKIKTEVDKKVYYPLKKGLYETNRNTEGIFLTTYLMSPSYVSFEYVLSTTGLIPERVYAYTCATTLKRHTTKYSNIFGDYIYEDVPVYAFRFGINLIETTGYSYFIATKEKALCDLLYKKRIVNSIKELKELLFEDLRVDEEMFWDLDFEVLKSLIPKYKKKNLELLGRLIKKGKK